MRLELNPILLLSYSELKSNHPQNHFWQRPAGTKNLAQAFSSIP
jgi:hypothetical protein